MSKVQFLTQYKGGWEPGHGGVEVEAWTDNRRPTQISTRPRANKQGCVKCRSHVPLPAVPTQGVIPKEGGY